MARHHVEMWIVPQSGLFTFGIKILPRRSERRCPHLTPLCSHLPFPCQVSPKGPTRSDQAEASPQATEAVAVSDGGGWGGEDRRGVRVALYGCCDTRCARVPLVNSSCVHTAAFGPVKQQIG